ncbi:MAG: GGDEF domain-containing protein [Thermoleophilia bacterium]|nr:GGDEF domain-containing protein [Thermoleophilia bacterium]
MLSAVFLALVASSASGGAAVVSADAAVAVGALACLNMIVNGVFAVRPPGEEPVAATVVQLLVDGALAVVAALLLDPDATPLAWVALLVPVLDAAVLSGPLLAGAVWLALGLAYIALRVRTMPPDGSGTEILRLGLQQLAAAAAVAIPTGYLAARLRDDLDRAHQTLLAASRRADELERVATHARTLTETADPGRVLEEAAAAALDLGFLRVDVCRRDGSGRWRLAHAAGEGRSPDPDADRALDRALADNRPALTGAGGAATDELQWLHLAGFAGGVVIPVWRQDGRAAAMRAFTDRPLEPDDTGVQALTLLGTQAAAAWGNALRYTSLAGWSQMVAYEAAHDALTGLANRAQLMMRLTHALERRRAGGPSFALLYLDLNGFKQVNDTLGHDAGDAVLIAVAQRLTRVARPTDTVARLGGDEFVLLLTDTAELRGAVIVAERVCAALSRPVAVGEHRAPVGTSVGVAWADGTHDVEEILRRADEAMYRAKRRRRTGFALADGLAPPDQSAQLPPAA